MTLNASQEISLLRETKYETRRPTVPAMEEILYEPIPLLDHGFIRVIDYMGDDSAVVQAARVSYGKGTKQINEDKGLINYLLRHFHTTPFEMCEIKFHLKMPIFVARQWLRHRTASVNEYSARYSILDREFYVPEPDQLAIQSKTNRQGRAETLNPFQAHEVLQILKEDATKAYDHYQQFLNQDMDGQVIDPEKPGIARELARINLPVNYYTQMYWKINLHNWMHFLRLRADEHAQYEIRVYAQAMLDVFQRWVPFTYQAFCDYRLNSMNLSAKALQAIKLMLKGETVTAETVGMSPGEWREFQGVLAAS
jgi:thymidylate synthase (FAD)